MADIAVQNVIGKYPVTPLTAGAAAITFQAMELAGDTYSNTGKELVLLRNDDAGAVTITVTSQRDEKNRLGTISAYSIPAGEYAAFGPFPVSGWNDGNNKVNLLASDVDLKVAVLRFEL